jgi:hypothetical protein
MPREWVSVLSEFSSQKLRQRNLASEVSVDSSDSGERARVDPAIGYFRRPYAHLHRSADQIRKIGDGDGLTRTHESTDVAIPAVIAVAHVRVTPAPEMEHVHGTHVHTDAAFVAAVLVDLDPGVGRLLQ